MNFLRVVSFIYLGLSFVSGCEIKHDVQSTVPVVRGDSANSFTTDRSTQGDLVFKAVAGPLPEKSFRSVFMLSTELGWLSRDGTIWKTDNGGESWEIIYEMMGNPAMEIANLYFFNESLGWFTIGGELYSTQDGGATWAKNEELGLKFDGIVRGIEFDPQRMNLYVFGGVVSDLKNPSRSYDAFRAAIIMSRDFGKNWEPLSVPFSNGEIIALSFINIKKYVAIGERSEDVFVTNDGGITWERDSTMIGSINKTRTQNELRPILASSFDGTTIVIGLSNGLLIENSGTQDHWEVLAKSSEIWSDDEKGLGYFWQIVPFDKNNGIGLKVNGWIYFTKDGGRTWRRVDRDHRFKQISKVSSDTAMAISDSGIVLIAPQKN